MLRLGWCGQWCGVGVVVAVCRVAGGVGCLGVVVLAALYRRLSWKALVKSVEGALRVSTMALLIIFGSATFSKLLAFSGASSGLIGWATSFEFAPLLMLLVMFAILLVLGMFIYVMASSVMATPAELVPQAWSQKSLPLLAMTTLSYPLVDTLRVFTLRVLDGRSPFSPDRNHLHHKILRFGYSHLQTAFIIHTYTLIMVVIGFLMPTDSSTLAFFILLGVAFMLPVLLFTAEKVQLILRTMRHKKASAH